MQNEILIAFGAEKKNTNKNAIFAPAKLIFFLAIKTISTYYGANLIKQRSHFTWLLLKCYELEYSNHKINRKSLI